MMMNYRLFLSSTVAATLVSISAPTYAASSPTSTIRLTGDYTGFTGEYGSRQTTMLEWSGKIGTSRVVAFVAQGRRTFDSTTQSAVHGGASYSHDWGSGLFSRSGASFGSSNGLFASRDVVQEFGARLSKSALVTTGLKLAKYHDREVRSIFIAPTFQYARGSVTYRFTASNAPGFGTNLSHLVSASLSDTRGGGQTQMWLGLGSTLDNPQNALEPRRESSRGVTIRRVQPIGPGLSLAFGLGRASYRPAHGATYRGTSAIVGLTVRR